MFCPLMQNPNYDDCRKCNNECLNFNLLVICEHPENGSSLIPRLKKLLVNQQKVNIFINALETDVVSPLDLLPKIDSSLNNYLDSKGYPVVIYRSFDDLKYDGLIKYIMESTGGGAVVYGSEKFMTDIQERIYATILKFSPKDRDSIIKKIKIKFVKEIIEQQIDQQRLF